MTASVWRGETAASFNGPSKLYLLPFHTEEFRNCTWVVSITDVCSNPRAIKVLGHKVVTQNRFVSLDFFACLSNNDLDPRLSWYYASISVVSQKHTCCFCYYKLPAISEFNIQQFWFFDKDNVTKGCIIDLFEVLAPSLYIKLKI